MSGVLRRARKGSGLCWIEALGNPRLKGEINGQCGGPGLLTTTRVYNLQAMQIAARPASTTPHHMTPAHVQYRYRHKRRSCHEQVPEALPTRGKSQTPLVAFHFTPRLLRQPSSVFSSRTRRSIRPYTADHSAKRPALQPARFLKTSGKQPNPRALLVRSRAS